MTKLLVVLTFILFACTNPDRARSTLEGSGFTSIQITGWSRGCSDGDATCTSFVAIGPSGKPVSGAVGCGRVEGCSKGCTIRLD